jgi:hypothetical protein
METEREKPMKRKRIRTIHGLIEAGGVARNGAATHGAAIGLYHNGEDEIALNLSELIVKHGETEQAKEGAKTCRETLHETENTAQRVVMEGRDSLKVTLGYVHSDVWTTVGLPKSLQVPKMASKLIPVMETMRLFYNNHAALEVVPRNITAAKIGEVLDGLKTAKAAFTAQKATLRKLRIERRDLKRAMQLRLSSLADEVKHLLGPDDSRHLDFGFKIPAIEQTPDVPANLQLVLSGSGAAAITWDHAPRVARYRVWKRVHGVDMAWIAVGSTSDRDMTIRDLPAKARIEIAVSAVNSGGESRKSMVLAFDMP